VDLLYSTLVADGSTLPPVLITNDPHLPAEIDEEVGAFVVYVPDVSKPSAKTTQIYFDKVQDYFDNDDHLIMDRGTEFQNREVQELLALHRIEPHVLPTGGGAFFNPNDNSFFAEVEGYYKRIPKLSHVDAIKRIVEAYKRVPDEHVTNHFMHCRLIGDLPTAHDVKRLITKSWIYDEKRNFKYGSYRKQYRYWLHNDRRLSEDVRRSGRPQAIGDNSLDGNYWTEYH
jgi:hypothetical protein